MTAGAGILLLLVVATFTDPLRSRAVVVVNALGALMIGAAILLDVVWAVA